MKTYVGKTQENSRETTKVVEGNDEGGNNSAPQLKNHRSAAIAQQEMQDQMNASQRTVQLRAIQKLADNSPKTQQARQLQAMVDTSRLQQQPLQKKANNSGLPQALKSGIENLSGMPMDDVKVHRNSNKPAQLKAHAYAQGTDIHLGPGQERHLPHEAWHVVQQKRGRVKPTLQMKSGIGINDDDGLEKEADVMGAKALQLGPSQVELKSSKANSDGKLDQKKVLQPMMRRRGNKKEEPNSTVSSRSSSSASARPYDHIEKIAAGTTCYRFITLLGDATPDTGIREFTDDSEGGVSLTLDPSATPKGRKARGRWKSTYKLKANRPLYICKSKGVFETVLKADPTKLCYTRIEAELKCSAREFWNIFELLGWERHQPEAENKEEKKAIPSDSELPFLDVDWDAEYGEKFKQRLVEIIPKDQVSSEFNEDQIPKFTEIGGGQVTSKTGSKFTVVHFDAKLDIYYLKVGWS